MSETQSKVSKTVASNGGASGIWLLGFIGALVYYLHYHSGSFGLVLIAIFKALVWPAYLVYYLLQLVKA
jgi:hypothetical protein